MSKICKFQNAYLCNSKNTIRFKIIDFVFNTDFRIANFPLLNSNKKCKRFANFKMHICAILKIRCDSESLILYLILTLELENFPILHLFFAIQRFANCEKSRKKHVCTFKYTISFKQTKLNYIKIEL